MNARLSGQSEVEQQLQQKYVHEIDSRTKLADMYKGSSVAIRCNTRSWSVWSLILFAWIVEMSEESSRKAEELTKTVKELQNLLNEASVQYEDLERKFTINEKTYEEHLQKKNETIAALKQELVNANRLIETLKQSL